MKTGCEYNCLRIVSGRRLLLLNLVVLLPKHLILAALPRLRYVSSLEVYSIKDIRYPSSLQQLVAILRTSFFVLCNVYGDEWDQIQDPSDY